MDFRLPVSYDQFITVNVIHDTHRSLIGCFPLKKVFSCVEMNTTATLPCIYCGPCVEEKGTLLPQSYF